MAASSSKVQVVAGDLLLAEEDYLCHQCNCVSKTAAGLASKLFRRFPVANEYSTRTTPSVPGTVTLHELSDASSKVKGILNLFAQKGCGKPRGLNDSQDLRFAWFEECLQRILELVPPDSSFAFPMGIGCGMGGGDWAKYLPALHKWSEDPRVKKLVLYQLDQQPRRRASAKRTAPSKGEEQGASSEPAKRTRKQKSKAE